MDVGTLGVLIVLALVDSTSVGTLLIPVWLLTTPGRLRPARVVGYLAVVTAAYLLVGVLLFLGLSSIASHARAIGESPGFLAAVLVLGIGLIVVSWLMDTKKARARAAEHAATGGGGLLRWRRRVMDEPSPRGAAFGLMGLAVAAVVLELATMVPYLAAIGIIASADVGVGLSVGVIAGYCVVMILPAIVLTIGRSVAHRALESPLRRLDGWLTRNAQATTAWIIGVVGFLLAVHAVAGLGWVDIGTGQA
ncbi:MAG: GAP family protein [Microbacterium arborescens]